MDEGMDETGGKNNLFHGFPVYDAATRGGLENDETRDLNVCSKPVRCKR